MMSKRRRKKSPNLPQQTLERARQQLETGTATEAPTPEPAPVETESPVEQPARSRRRAAAPLAQVSEDRPRRKRQVSYEEMDAETIADILAHPTKFVSEEELRAQYGYVLADLRSMALLSAALLVALVIMAQVL